MKPKMRRAGLLAATLMMVVAAFWRATPAVVAGFSPEQTGPVAGSAPARTIPPKELTLEERADIFMAKKNYGDAADYYYRALKQSSFKDPVVWNKLGIAFQAGEQFPQRPQSLHQRNSRQQEFRRGVEQPGHRILHGEEVWKIGEVLPAGDRVKGRQCLFPYESGHILLSPEEVRSGRGRVSHRSRH